MSKNSNDSARKGEMTVQGDYATIQFKRILKHPPEQVWEAITEPEDIKQWLMCSSVRNDQKAGGLVEMVSGPAQFHSKGKILTWDPPKIFEYEWHVDPVKEMPKGEKAIFHFELTPHSQGTLLTVTYRNITKNTAYGFTPGTHVLLDRLEAQLNQETLPNWFSRFSEIQSLYPAWPGPK